MLPVLLIVLLFFIFLFICQLNKRRKLPPGPFPFPILGNIPQLALKTRKHGGIVGAMKEWQKEYGPIFVLWVGTQPTVHICSMDLAQETMVKRGSEFADRWVPNLFLLPRNGLGIIGTSGALWQEQRRFALHTLRNFGLGKSLMEERIMEEFRIKTSILNEKCGEETVEIDPKPFFDVLVGSVINRMIFNETLNEKNASEFEEIKRQIDTFFDSVSMAFLTGIFTRIPLIREKYKNMVDPMKEARKYFKKQIEQRMQAIEIGDHVLSEEAEDYVDAFLLKMKEEQENAETTFKVETLIANIMDIWIAGQDTTVTTILAGFAQLLNNVEIIPIVREELLKITKGERLLSLKDKPQTPIFNATLMEIQRHASVLNVNLFRQVRENTEIGGHPIEKGTPVSAQLSLILSDEKHFKECKKFDPFRFLKEEKPEQQMIPFGLGRRSCPGESLARAELYIIIGNMILNYHMEPSENLPKTELPNDVSLMKRQSAYTMRIRRLNNEM